MTIFNAVNLVAVGIAAIAAFVFGAIYYTALAKPWAAAQGKSSDDFKPSAMLFIITFVGCLIISFVMAGLLYHVGGYSVRSGVISAALIWVGFVLPTVTVNNAYRGGSVSLTVIDSLHWFGALMLAAAIIGWFGV